MVINLAEVLPGEFTRNPEFSLPTQRLKRTISSLAGPANTHFVNASALSTALLGQSLGANMFMLGYAYQLGGAADLGGGDRDGDRDERRGRRHESSRRSAGAAAPRSTSPRSRRWRGRRPMRPTRRA